MCIWLLCIVLLLNVYSVIYSTKKCNYPDLYKIRLVLVTSFIILLISTGVWYGTYGSVFGFKFDAAKEVAEATGTITPGEIFAGKVDCPNPSSSGYDKEFTKLKKDDPKKARKCLSYYQTLDVDKGIYA